ncbi:anthranilate/aminodeoxychorismate synthase component II [candidate division GN15 bacterium]|nr:anthranilate/aminodeoxychorismate synthase component II [candidate division GN15 bacterium]
MVLIIDNYDSFVYNLAQYVGEAGFTPMVHRHDAITLANIRTLAPSHIIISPGPKTPEQAGLSVSIIREFSSHIPTLGVCLGHQCIGVSCGARITTGYPPVHGKQTTISHDRRGVFRGLPEAVRVGRYHSLVIDESTLPHDLIVTARTEDGTIMGIRHRRRPVEGVQFHPESILTEHGRRMIDNFLRMTGESAGTSAADVSTRQEC